MTIKEIKAVFNSYRDTLKRCRRLELRVAEARRDVISIRACNYGKIKVAGGEIGCGIDIAMARLMDRERVYNLACEELFRSELTINNLLDKLDGSDAKILSDWAIDGKSTYDIARERGVAPKTISNRISYAFRKMADG